MGIIYSRKYNLFASLQKGKVNKFTLLILFDLLTVFLFVKLYEQLFMNLKDRVEFYREEVFRFFSRGFSIYNSCIKYSYLENFFYVVLYLKLSKLNKIINTTIKIIKY